MNSAGGDQQFLTFGFVADDNDRQMPATKNPITLTYTVADDPSKPYVAVCEAADDDKQPRLLRLNLPGGSSITCAMPQTSPTSVLRSVQSRLNGSHISTTPPVISNNRLAVWLASLARVLVRAMPTPTGMPVRLRSAERICRPNADKSPSMPVRSANASSM